MPDDKTLSSEFGMCRGAVTAAGGTLPVFKPADNIPDRHFTVAVIGDSLIRSKYPEQLEKTLQDAGWNVSVQNLGVEGRMMDYALEMAKNLDVDGAQRPDVVMIALGGNDAVYGIMAMDPIIKLPEIKRNEMLEKMLTRMGGNLEGAIQELKDKGVPVMVAGMKAPVIFPEEIRGRFDNVFRDMAQKHGLVMDPFIMNAIVKNPKSKDLGEIFHRECMDDGIHPNTQGGALIATDLAQEVQEALLRISGQTDKRPEPAQEVSVANPLQGPGAGH